ncbi:PTS sugar transporter subunit IIA [Enterococcus cecorum]|uniref:PTS sugar transporter subunit IIA n=1 Tax=Enterococcus cecorum TaxID=44008 RepID=A0AAW9JRM8_9ENTE|nr:PTS sugar transporter subunit IIA [Enterococcus cecorum]MDZ5503588.1 PTS sugar transporter subunit IIA [Enterococcus cecorum]MDZ5531186.1 PTS sugar transporter subunit IIA [Enterococcus cecorum]MDZ5544524.1 PTS sugar transporter subunit IIA [Enterococcus cecorum]MDZ5548949.1 PTS sugar transporter subunit IIA [Enterococcus cecorum]MDZ5550964.1 PTS sugar transporter subunit IIA [Enterococcus cecorum]
MLESMDLKNVINRENVLVDIEGTTKEEVLKALCNQLFNTGYINDVDDFYADVLAREEEGLTGLGKGIAIPHGKSESVINTTIAIGKTKQPIEWGSLDDKPVEVILLFAVKNSDATTTHIKLLQKVAIMLADDEFLVALQKAENEDELFGMITQRD